MSYVHPARQGRMAPPPQQPSPPSHSLRHSSPPHPQQQQHVHHHHASPSSDTSPNRSAERKRRRWDDDDAQRGASPSAAVHSSSSAVTDNRSQPMSSGGFDQPSRAAQSATSEADPASEIEQRRARARAWAEQKRQAEQQQQQIAANEAERQHAQDAIRQAQQQTIPRGTDSNGAGLQDAINAAKAHLFKNAPQLAARPTPPTASQASSTAPSFQPASTSIKLNSGAATTLSKPNILAANLQRTSNTSRQRAASNIFGTNPLTESNVDVSDNKQIQAVSKQLNGVANNNTSTNNDTDDEDPLDAYMKSLDTQAVKQQRFGSTAAETDTEMSDHTALKPEPNGVTKRENGDTTMKSENGTDTSVKAEADSADSTTKSAEPNAITRDRNSSSERYFDDSNELDEVDIDQIDDGTSLEYSDAMALKEKRKAAKAKAIKKLDHTTIEYPPFRKNFYIEPREIAQMTDEEVARYRALELEGVKIRGKAPIARPMRTWQQSGLSDPVLHTITQKDKFPSPFPIQAQAIPVIMSGRDVIACAKTGSGKTLAFVLPMIRHIADQSPLKSEDGPIALVLAPTRELAAQIHTETKRYGKPHSIQCLCIYGGTGVGEQIALIRKGGNHVLIATPGRLIEILTTNNGKLINLVRITYVVLDEADRMFDMGFAPQIEMIIVNLRPDRQTVMFSATFPRIVEQVARKILKQPVEIIIGGRSIASSNIHQIVEVRNSDSKLPRLLELLGHWYNTGNILVFVDKQEVVERLATQMTEAGYNALSLHGGMNQLDRDYAVADFKSGARPLLIATSIVARGLDVQSLVLVVNYNVPNHIEDYVHRIGRTGRGSKQGTAVTFVQPDEAKYAPALVAALEATKQEVSVELRALAKKAGGSGKGQRQLQLMSGYGGKGFKFDENEAAARDEKLKKQRDRELHNGALTTVDVDEDAAKAQAKELAKEESMADANATTDAHLRNIIERDTRSVQRPDGSYDIAPEPVAPSPTATKTVQPPAAIDLIAAQIAAARKAAELAVKATGAQGDAEAVAAALTLKTQLLNRALQPGSKYKPGEGPKPAGGETVTESGLKFAGGVYSAEVEVNDAPQQARWQVTRQTTIAEMSAEFGVSITQKGSYVAPGTKSKDRPLYLFIESREEHAVLQCKREIERELASSTAMAKTMAAAPGSGRRGGRYKVIGGPQHAGYLR